MNITDPTVSLILNTVDDLVSDFLYYGRKEDEDLPRGAIEDAIAAGKITADDIIERFRVKFTESL